MNVIPLKNKTIKNMNGRGYTQGEIIAIFAVSAMILILTVIYYRQSSKEAVLAGVREKVKAQAISAAEELKKDVSKAKKGSMEVTPIGKTGAKIVFDILENNTLMPVVYTFEKPKLFRKVKGKQTQVADFVAGLKINEDFSTGEMEIEISILYNKDLDQSVSYTEKTSARMIDNVPEDVKILTEDGIELSASSSGDETDEVKEDASSDLELFSQYANFSEMDLKKNKISFETELESLKKRESEIDVELSSTPPGIKHQTYPLALPGIKDVYVLDLAAKQPAIDQQYVDTIKKKIDNINNQLKMKQELKIINSIIAQREKK